jgi:pyruvate/2-oxoglutarate dehydrogenase complex dihydrolipoamide dehydrogenase (E3) component
MTYQMDETLDLIIIGGGLQGTILSHLLTATGALEPERLAVVDPGDKPFRVWRVRTAATEMTHLRSPSSHHSDLSFHALRDYARRTGRYGADTFVGPYERPALAVFNDHCREVFERNRLDRYRRKATVTAVLPAEGAMIGTAMTVETDAGSLTAKRVLFAVGRESAPVVPEAFQAITGASSMHLYAPGYDAAALMAAPEAAIIGGGISALQLALRREAEGLATTVISPHPLRVSQFDSDPCFIGPRCLASFDTLTAAEERSRVLAAAGNPGSVPPDIAVRFAAAVEKGAIGFVVGTVASATGEAGGYELRLDDGSPAIRADRLVFATGFEATLDPEGLIARTARELELPVDRSGRPVTDRCLRWHPRIFVTGAAAELSIGPAAANIIGAHLAARRIVPFLRTGALGREAPWTPLSPTSSAPGLATYR